MKIIECYIENFGKISARGYSFKDGLNCIKEDNGSGKTTLAVFIKVMLYGMSDTKKTSLEENDRKHYLPWGGGACGGSLTFSVGEKTYRIQRSFAPKAADDSFALYDTATGRVCADFGENLGEELFGIDVDGFERTVFLSERSLTPKSDNKTISAKLSDLVGCDGDIGGMDNALKNLENQRKFYQKKGGSGEISDIKAKISDTNKRIDALNKTEEALAEAEKKLGELSKELSVARQNSAELARKREKASIKAADNGYETRCKELESALADNVAKRSRLLEIFGGKIPSFNEIDQAAYKSTEAKNLLQRQSEGAENKRYRELLDFFGGQPSSEDIERIKYKVKELEDIKARENSPAARRAKELFARRVPSGEEIREISRLQKKKIGRISSGVFIICALLCVAGAITGLLISPALFSLCAFGALIAIVTAITVSASKNKSKKKADEFFLSVTEKLPTDSKETHRMLEEMLLLLPEAEGLADGEYIKGLEDEICLFNSRFNSHDDDCISVAKEIIEKHSELTALAMADRYLRENKEDTLRRAEILRTEVAEFLSGFKLTDAEPFSQLREALTELNRLSSEISSKETEIATLKSKRALGEDGVKEAKEELARIDDENEALNEKIALLNREYTLTERACRTYSEELECRDELVMRLGELEETLAKTKENYDIILQTKKYLQAACDSMTSRYIGKTKESFVKYTELIGGAKEDRFEMDTDFGVSKIEGAATKTVDAYSRGTKDLYNLASRLALVDSLYDQEEPFIIMDDPFTALDDSKTKAALELLEKLAKERQIIYFTCSRSRALKS